MMHEDEFKEIMEAYRQLRKEGIKFPEREKNEKYMIQFKGQQSPIFEYLENQPDVISETVLICCNWSRETAADFRVLEET
jgi:hypothetical protein